jgi:hypothetical protein
VGGSRNVGLLICLERTFLLQQLGAQRVRKCPKLRQAFLLPLLLLVQI